MKIVFKNEDLKVSHIKGHDRVKTGISSRHLLFETWNGGANVCVPMNKHSIKQLGERLLELARELE